MLSRASRSAVRCSASSAAVRRASAAVFPRRWEKACRGAPGRHRTTGPRNVTAAWALVFALDAAAAGPPLGRALARQAALRGERVGGDATTGDWRAPGGERPTGLTVPEDLHEAWAERIAIMVEDGGLPPAEAERLAGAGFHAPVAER